MALKKNITFANRGLSGGVVKVCAYRWDATTRESSAMLGLYRDDAHAATPGASPMSIVAKVRLNGELFDAYFGKDALGKLRDRDPIRAQFYRAAAAGKGVVCDLGPDAFKDAASDDE